MKNEYTPIQKQMLKEIKTFVNLNILNDRIDYISCLILFYCKNGRLKFIKKYPSFKNFTMKDLSFYLEELQKRKLFIIRMQELDNVKYRKAGLI